jgi:methyl-branched lipid omega-hydroxylase
LRQFPCFKGLAGLPRKAAPWEAGKREDEAPDDERENVSPSPLTGELDMSRTEFWARPRDWRYAAFRQLRALEAPPFFDAGQSPFGAGGRGYYALLRHGDVTEASRDPAVFSSASGATSIYDVPPAFSEYFGSMISMDDPRHGRLRRIVSRGFTPKMIRQCEEGVRRAAARVVGELLEDGPGDFVQQVSARLPLKIICDLMGISAEDYPAVLRNTNLVVSGGDPEFASEDLAEFRAQLLSAAAELGGLAARLAQERQEKPAGDLVTALVAGDVDGERLTPAEIASFFILLVTAGSETTRNAISHALVLLTQHPDQRKLLLEDLHNRIGPAVDEVVRAASPVIWMRRTVTRDTRMRGARLREGDKVLLVYQSANRDGAVFPDPDRFDITRSPNPHVGFGAAGPHFCLGANLARAEITAVLRELLTRVPGIRAAGEPDWLVSNFSHGIKHLPCDFG